MVVFKLIFRYWYVITPTIIISSFVVNSYFEMKTSKNKTETQTKIIKRRDSLVVKVDSIVNNIETQKKVLVQKVYELQKEKNRYKDEATCEKKKRITEIEKIKKNKKPTQVKVEEKILYVDDPKTLEDNHKYQQENHLLKEELEKTRLMNQRLKSETEYIKKSYTKPDTMVVDTVRKRKKILGLF